MKERPILFSTPMVQALLQGTKTQTRRVVKTAGVEYVAQRIVYCDGKWQGESGRIIKCPYGQIGDLLWVRESFRLTQPYEPETYYFGYKDGFDSTNPASSKYDFAEPDVWKPSIHMPKEAARIWLRITNIRVERLQDISEADAKAEGVALHERGVHYLNYYDQKHSTTQFIYNCRNAYDSFRSLWYVINGKRDEPFAWYKNPWVWVIDFERI